MTPTSGSFSAGATATRPLRIGYLAFTDAAPLVAAHELGFFAQQGVRVDLQREVGWATIREKIIYGELDAAHVPAPLLWAMQLGIGSPVCEVLTAQVMNLHGSAITLSRALREAGAQDPAVLREWVRARRLGEPPVFGVNFLWSAQYLMLRDWLRAAGLQPEREVRIVVVPPGQMFRNLGAGAIDGFCASEPWNTLAVRDSGGWCPAWSAALRPGQPDKVLLVTRRFAEGRAAEHAPLVRALHDAAAWCDEPQNRERLADLLAGSAYINLPARAIAPPLLGKFETGTGRVESVPDFHVFHHHEASAPVAEKALALQQALGAAGLLPAPVAKDNELPRKLFREDLHREILGLHAVGAEPGPAPGRVLLDKRF